MAAPSISTPFFAASTRHSVGDGRKSPSGSYSSTSNDSFLVDNSLDDNFDDDEDNVVGDCYAIPHNLTSFLERRPLARRTVSLLPSGVDHRLVKQADEIHAPEHLHDDYSDDIHHTHHVVQPVQRGRDRTARSRDNNDNNLERLRWEMNDFVKATVWANHDTVRLRPSVCGQDVGEVPVKGIFVQLPDAAVAVPHWLLPTQGEHMHVHADGTAHMIMSLADTATAIECGWAERLPLPVFGNHRNHSNHSDDHHEHMSGIQYVSVHAPRSASELADWKRLVLASVRFCTFTLRDLSIRRPERL
ncbi:MAG: hypothetical protein STHCBS139747_004959 [Sporothrix thermara]